MYKRLNARAARLKRRVRVRARISGTPERLRLNVFRSSAHIYAQIINDSAKTEAASAFDHLGHAVDHHDPFLKIKLRRVDSGHAGSYLY